ncbi:Fanconi anemia core complex-associated protein 100 [Callorhinchus milii]|uniref:Fanconi anemia core complex-associated protein 100 n=1 Tax=Callorhinchus milii TaxID=7868 RepID=UPI001C3F9CF9|nr:Fanconi anemia core complex-associated protein 100 [Callorhinchus milii]
MAIAAAGGRGGASARVRVGVRGPTTATRTATLCNGSRCVYVYYPRDGECQRVVYRLPNAVWHVELDWKQEWLYVLCAGSGIYCVSLNHQTSPDKETDHLKPSEDAAQSRKVGGCHVPLVHTVGADRCLSRDSELWSFILSDDVLVTVAKEGMNWRISTLRLPALGSELQKSGRVEETNVAFHPIFKSNLPGCEERSSVPVFCCVYPETATNPWRGEGSDAHFSLDSSLFGLLFGVDASMVNAPMILCGLPDGQLCCFSLRLAGSAHTRASHGRSEVKGQMRVLHHLEQPVVYIGALALKQEVDTARETSCNCVVVVGKGGKVVVIKPNPQLEAVQAPDFVEYHLRGPIVCACCCADVLYYSTRSDLFSIELVCSRSPPSPGDRVTSDKSGPGGAAALPSVLTPVSLNVCGVLAVSAPLLTSEGDVDLVAFTEKGKVMVITLPHSPGEAQSTKFTAAEAGQRIKDLLSGIAGVSDRVTLLKSTEKQKDKALKGLNQDFNICCALLGRRESQGTGVTTPCKRPVTCRVTVRWDRLLLQDSLVISCTLENLSDWTLEHRWTLCVKIVSQARNLTPGCDRKAITYTFPINKLPPSKKMEVTLPLKSGTDGTEALPASVHCFLHYSLKCILGNGPSTSRNSLPRGLDVSEKEGMCLPLDMHTVDLLDCLRIREGAVDEWAPAHHVHHHRAADTLQTFLQSFARPGASGLRGRDVAGSDGMSAGPLVASIKLSTDVVKVGLKEFCAGTTVAHAVLRWLLSANSEMEATRTQLSSVVNGTAPDGTSVRLQAKEVVVAGLSAEGPISAVEIEMTCSSLTVFCFLHQAVTRRVQVLLTRAPCSISLPGLQVQSLRQLVHHAETLLKEVQSLRDRLYLGEEENRIETANKLLHVYWQLRNTDLVAV